MFTKADKKWLLENLASKNVVETVKEDLKTLKKDASSIRETVEFTKEGVINLLDWTQDIHETVTGQKTRIRPS